ncbi:MAG: hypothetical protein ACI8W7_000002 [Gammaproteobacteria bacterium]|jgi:hypothetical protein
MLATARLSRIAAAKNDLTNTARKDSRPERKVVGAPIFAIPRPTRIRLTALHAIVIIAQTRNFTATRNCRLGREKAIGQL